MGITKVESQNLNTDAIERGEIDDNAIDSSKINATITNADISPSAAIPVAKVALPGPPSQFVRGDGSFGAIDTTGVDENAFNIGVLGFKMAVNDGLTIFNLVDGVVDEFNDESGVDTGENSNASYDSTSDFYTNQGTNIPLPSPQIGRTSITSTGSGTYSVEPTITAVDVLVIGGAGGAGAGGYNNSSGGGGGAGGLIFYEDYPVTPGGSIPVSVGAGGRGGGGADSTIAGYLAGSPEALENALLNKAQENTSLINDNVATITTNANDIENSLNSASITGNVIKLIKNNSNLADVDIDLDNSDLKTNLDGAYSSMSINNNTRRLRLNKVDGTFDEVEIPAVTNSGSIDHLVKKSGDDLLYNLTNLNADLNIARSCVIGISNDLTFTDYLDPRVRSRLGQEDVIFAPYKANHLVDILKKRSEVSISQGSIDKGVIELCSALAAQEHGDARKALDLLRVSTEKADQENSSLVSERHVRMAQNQIECDQITPVIATLPFQQKLVLYSVLINENNGLNNIATGEVYEIYKQACRFGGVNFLTQRRVTDLISNLDMLGLISAKTVSRGRYGRSKEINSCIPVTIAASEIMRNADPGMIPVVKGKFRLQSRL